MPTPHPLFLPLHAHLSGASALLDSGISAETLLSLYPLEVDSYRTFLTDFYREHPSGGSWAGGQEGRRRAFAEALNAVELRVSMSLYKDEQYDRYFDLAFGGYKSGMNALADELAAAYQELSARELSALLDHLLRTMFLLLDWPEVEVERSFEKYEESANTLDDFFEGFEAVLRSWNIRVRFDTPRRKSRMSQWLAECAAQEGEAPAEG